MTKIILLILLCPLPCLTLSCTRHEASLSNHTDKGSKLDSQFANRTRHETIRTSTTKHVTIHDAVLKAMKMLNSADIFTSTVIVAGRRYGYNDVEVKVYRLSLKAKGRNNKGPTYTIRFKDSKAYLKSTKNPPGNDRPNHLNMKKQVAVRAYEHFLNDEGVMNRDKPIKFKLSVRKVQPGYAAVITSLPDMPGGYVTYVFSENVQLVRIFRGL